MRRFVFNIEPYILSPDPNVMECQACLRTMQRCESPLLGDLLDFCAYQSVKSRNRVQLRGDMFRKIIANSRAVPAMLACAFLVAGCTVGNGRICGPQTPRANCDKEVLERLLSGAPLERPAPEVQERLVYQSTPAPRGQSRIRVFGQNGIFVELHIGSACIRDEAGKRVSGDFGGAFGSMLGLASNTSVGIPETPTSYKIKDKSRIFSTAYFREYVIPPGTPTSIRMGAIGAKRYGTACVRTLSLTPRDMEDYEVDWVAGGGRCELMVNRVVNREGYVDLERVPVADAPDCAEP